MLKMRLQRIGRRNSPAYRVLVVDSRQGPKSGKYIDQVGAYDPKTGHYSIDGDKARSWIDKGVQLSGTVHNMLISQKVIEGKKVNVLPKKTPIVQESAEGAATENDTAEAETPASGEGEAQAESQEESKEESTKDSEQKETEESSESEEQKERKTEESEEGPTESHTETQEEEESKTTAS